MQSKSRQYVSALIRRNLCNFVLFRARSEVIENEIAAGAEVVVVAKVAVEKDTKDERKRIKNIGIGRGVLIVADDTIQEDLRVEMLVIAEEGRLRGDEVMASIEERSMMRVHQVQSL